MGASVTRIFWARYDMHIKIGNLKIPQPLLEAIRDQQLVVFAGSGVSNPEPSSLPGFEELAESIALGTGLSKEPEENVVQYLGRLERNRVDIRSKTHDLLKINSKRKPPKPSSLHYDILRLFENFDSVRLVTTNFDDLFEQASKEVFGDCPELFRAPALPLGKEFCGIVHLHGSLEQTNRLILTDVDFGRAYLTEGWATRFLVDLYQNYSVIFVGYSHTDPIVDYLAKAIPKIDHVNRYALIDGDESARLKRWRTFGVELIEYPNEDKTHSALAEDLKRLARYVRLEALDWKIELERIAQNGPPVNENDTSTVNLALIDVAKTRILTNAALKPEWIEWFDKKELFCNLFKEDELDERDDIFSKWLIEKIASKHPVHLLTLIEKYNCNLNRTVWTDLTRRVPEFVCDNRKWLLLILRTLPANPNIVELHALLFLGNVCSKTKDIDCLVEILTICANAHLDLLRREAWIDETVNDLRSNSALDNFWSEHLHLNRHRCAENLLSLSFNYLHEHHRIASVASESSNRLYKASFFRRAIEDHDQNLTRVTIDVFIDVCRDSLIFLAENEPEKAEKWCALLISTSSPLLIRLGIHTISQYSKIGPDQRINWILDFVDLHDPLLHHELFVALQSLYHQLNEQTRERVIESVKEYEADNNLELAALVHFDWLSMLSESNLNCELSSREFEKVKTEYPNFEISEHPEFNAYFTYSRQFDTQAAVLQKRINSEPIEKWIEELPSSGNFLFDPIYSSEVPAILIQKASEDTNWGIQLADALISTKNFNHLIWEPLVDAWSQQQLVIVELVKIQEFLIHEEILESIPKHVAKFLFSLDKKLFEFNCGGWSQIHDLAQKLWENHQPDRDYIFGYSVSIFTIAVIHPAGILTQFWLDQISEFRTRQGMKDEGLNEYFSSILTGIVRSENRSGTLARSILAANFDFLLSIDEQWVRSELFDFFNDFENESEFYSVWDGFLYQDGKRNQNTFEYLSESFFKAIPEFEGIFTEQLNQKFVKVLVHAIFFFIDSPLEVWVNRLLQNINNINRVNFAFSVGGYLGELNDIEKKERWDSWLKDYWIQRNRGIPAPLEDSEVEAMLSWIPELACVFDEGVEIALDMNPVEVKHPHLFSKIFELRLWENYPTEVIELLWFLRKYSKNSSDRFYADLVVKELIKLDLAFDSKSRLIDLSLDAGLESAIRTDHGLE